MKTFLTPRGIWYATLLVLLAWASGATAQTITGRVLDQQKQEALSFANVVLRLPTGDVKQAVLTDEQGAFTFKGVAPGAYQLQVLQLGFTTLSQAVQVAAGVPLQLGSLGLVASAQKLDEVVVTGRKPLIEQKADRVSMNVNGSLLAAGNDAYSILAMAPSVQLVDGQLSFRGKGNVLILLDGKRLPSGTNLETVLASIPGNQIDHIELISNPSARYDADASGGVIEIYTKRSQSLGWTANLGADARQGYRSGAGLNGGLRLSTPKLDLALSGSLVRRAGFERTVAHRTLYEGRTPVASLSQSGDIEKVAHDGSFSGSLNYHLDAKTTVGAGLDVLTGDLRGAGTAQADLMQRNGLTTNQIVQKVLLRDAFTNYTLFYRRTLDSLGSTLLLNGNYSTYTNRQEQAFDQYVRGPLDSASVPSSFRNSIPATYAIYTAAADYTKVWSPATRLETGLKYTDTHNESRQNAEILANDTWVSQPLTPFSQLGYRERVGAGYASFSHTQGPLTLQAGLRAEGTHYQVVSGIDSSYFNFFPNARADYKVSDTYTTSLAYAKNIRRPAYESLIPYERFVDTYTTIRGNAALRPEYLHSFSWNNLYKGYGLQLAYTQTVSAISTVYLYNEATLRFIKTFANLPSRHLATATLTAPLAPTAWWTMNNSVGINYQQLSFPDPLAPAATYTKRQTSVSLSTDNTFSWGHGWSTRVYGLYNSPSFSGWVDYDAYSYVSVGVRKTFLEKRASLSLQVVDLFYQLNFRVSSSIPPVVMDNTTRNDTRQVRLAFTYTFGKADLKGRHLDPKGNANEVNRLGK